MTVALHRPTLDWWRLHQHLGGDYWWQLGMHRRAYPGGEPVTQLQGSTIGLSQATQMVPVEQNAPRTGSWTFHNDPQAFEGRYARTTDVGATITYTTPLTKPVGVALNYVTASNAGYALVELSAGLVCDVLPTAADEVAAGRLSTSALIDNGGTLRPSDRLLDQYSADVNWQKTLVLARGLPSGRTTVTLTATGYKRPEATDTRVYLAGVGYPISCDLEDGFDSIDLPGSDTLASAWEYAWRIAVDGHEEWSGNVHGYETQTKARFFIDGLPAAPTVGEWAHGDELLMIRDTRQLHPALTSPWAYIRTVYRLNGDGLEVSHRTEVLADVDVVCYYPAMLPLPNGNDRGHVAGQTAAMDMSGTGASGGYLNADTATLWQSRTVNGLHVAHSMHIPDLTRTVNDFADAPCDLGGGLWIEDRDNGAVNKIYLPRVSTGAPDLCLTAGTVWHSQVRYTAGMQPDPEVELAL